MRDERRKKETGRAGKEERGFFVLGEAFQPAELCSTVSGQKRDSHHSLFCVSTSQPFSIFNNNV